MKRLLMGIAACALIMTSCTKKDVVENIADGQNQLSFLPGLGKQTTTKAAELNNVAMQTSATDATNGIALYAYQDMTGENTTWTPWFSDNVWYAENKWQIASTRFANTAASKYITFFPKSYVTNGVNLSTADFATLLPKFDCTIPNDNAKQRDLIAGITNVAQNKKEITLAMRHILSQINFGVKGYKGAYIQIQSIQIHDVYNKATYKYTNGDDTAPNIIGAWEAYEEFTKDDAANRYTYPGVYTTVPATAETGHKYIFGDGGNWGPGSGAAATEVWYPVGTSNGWIVGKNLPSTTAGMNNSLMLMPQNFTLEDAKNENAYVTFQYKIWDTGGDNNGANAGYAAGSPDAWEEGRFKLNFENGGGAYSNKWEQNYRYVYIIDFEKFIEDSKLDFTVDVEMYPWLNYNNPGDGIVGVPVAGIPTNTQLNALTNGDTWNVATRSTTPPTTQVQLVQTQTWNWADYTFTKLASGGTINIDFSNVILNGKTITINVSSGYKIYIGNEVDNQTVTVDADNTVVTIKRK